MKLHINLPKCYIQLTFLLSCPRIIIVGPSSMVNNVGFSSFTNCNFVQLVLLIHSSYIKKKKK